MKSSWNFIRLAILTVVISLCAGCGGIHATKSVNILDFFLPGIGGVPGLLQNKPAPAVERVPAHEAVPTLARAD